jgi:hypothetical protein
MAFFPLYYIKFIEKFIFSNNIFWDITACSLLRVKRVSEEHRLHVPPKCLSTFNGSDVSTSQEHVTTAERISNFLILFWFTDRVWNVDYVV